MLKIKHKILVIATTSLAVVGCDAYTEVRYLERYGEHRACGMNVYRPGISLQGHSIINEGDVQRQRDEECVQKYIAEGYRETKSPKTEGRR